MLPSQFFATSQSSPLQRLCVALLAGLFTVQQLAARHSHKRLWRRAVEAAIAWLKGEPALILFSTVCDMLSLSPAAVREAYFSASGNSQYQPTTASQTTV